MYAYILLKPRVSGLRVTLTKNRTHASCGSVFVFFSATQRRRRRQRRSAQNVPRYICADVTARAAQAHTHARNLMSELMNCFAIQIKHARTRAPPFAAISLRDRARARPHDESAARSRDALWHRAHIYNHQPTHKKNVVRTCGGISTYAHTRNARTRTHKR